jgi:hypothetical protein
MSRNSTLRRAWQTRIRRDVTPHHQSSAAFFIDRRAMEPSAPSSFLPEKSQRSLSRKASVGLSKAPIRCFSTVLVRPQYPFCPSRVKFRTQSTDARYLVLPDRALCHMHDKDGKSFPFPNFITRCAGLPDTLPEPTPARRIYV